MDDVLVSNFKTVNISDSTHFFSTIFDYLFLLKMLRWWLISVSNEYYFSSNSVLTLAKSKIECFASK